MKTYPNRKSVALLTAVLWMLYNFQLFFPNAVFTNLRQDLILGLMIATAFSAAYFSMIGMPRKSTVKSTAAALLKPVLVQMALLLPAFLFFWVMVVQGGWTLEMFTYANVMLPIFTMPLTAIACGYLAAALFSRWHAWLVIAPLTLLGSYFITLVLSEALLPWFGKEFFILVALLQIPVLFFAGIVYTMRYEKRVSQWLDRVGIAPLSRLMLRKEFRLQKNNLMLAVAATLLGALGIYMLPRTAPTLGSFSPEDIRSAVLFCFMLPTLIGILPLMIGCTAAASERALDVNRWQAALPVSARRVIGIKALAIVILCVIIGGAIPYLLALMGDSYGLLNTFFRGAWTGWLALLMAAIGFYGGSIARNDYHGLLLALFPASVVMLGMVLADPYFQVFPVAISIEQDFWKPFSFILRVLLLAVALMWLAGRLLRRPEQVSKPRLARHAALLFILAFAATLINFTRERQVIEKPLTRERWLIPGYSFNSDMVSCTASIFAGSIKGSEKTQLQLDIQQAYQVSRDFGTGMIRRMPRSSYINSTIHPFTVTSLNLREFPQAINANVVRASQDQRWILTQQDKGGYGYTICGPCNLAIASWMLPDSLFWRLSNLLEIKPLGSDYLRASRAHIGMKTPGNYVVGLDEPFQPERSDDKQYSYAVNDFWSSDTGTTVSFEGFYSLARIKLMNRDLLYVPFTDKGEVRIGSKTIGTSITVNQGVAIHDLATGKQTLHRFNNPLPANLLDARGQYNRYYNYLNEVCWHPGGAIAGYTQDYLTVLIPSRGTWDSAVITIRAKVSLQSVYNAVFAGPDAIIASNGQELQIIDLPR